MQAISNDVLLQRVERVEAENRTLKRMWIATALVATLFLVGGANSKRTEEVVTQKLVLLDKDGNVRAQLGTTDKGEPNLALMDQLGRNGFKVIHKADGGVSLNLFDPNNWSRLSLDFEPDGHTAFRISDHEGDERVSIRRQSDGDAGLVLFDDSMNLRSSFVLAKDGIPSLSFWDKDSVRLGMRLYPNGKPYLQLFNERTETRGFFGFYEDDDLARFSVSGRGGEGGVRAQAEGDGTSQLQIVDKEGKLQFQAPKP